MDSTLNISTAKTRDVLGHRMIYNHFCLRANGHEFQPKAITHEFFDQMEKNQKIMSCCFNSQGFHAEHFQGKNSRRFGSDNDFQPFLLEG